MANLLETIKAGCACTKTGLEINGEQVEARRYTLDMVALTRLHIIKQSEIVSGGWATVKDNVIDGIKYTREEWKIVSKSAATGGLSKRQCGFDKSVLERRFMEKVCETVRIYAHEEHCPNAAIGTQLQDLVFGQGGNGEAGLTNTDKYVNALLDAQTRAMTKSIPLGIYQGNDAVSAHFDGVIAQVVRQNAATYYHTIRYDLSEFDTDAERIFFKHGGTFATYATVEDLVDGVAALKDTNGDLLYTVYSGDGDGIVEITSNKAGYTIGVQIVVAATGTTIDWTCAEEESFTTLQNRMPFVQEPLVLPNTEITASNFISYFLDVKAKWLRYLDPDIDYSKTPAYMAIDPTLIQNEGVAALLEFNKAAMGFQLKTTGLEQFPWTFVPVSALTNTGLFYITVKGNIEVLTNSLTPGDGLKVGVDEKCENAWAKTDMLGNVVVLDFGIIGTNAFGTAFETEVLKTTAFVPENIPALCEKSRSNCQTVSVTDVANFTYEIAGSDITFEDTTLAPAGLTISSRAWSIEGNDNPSTIVSGGTGASGTAALGSLDGGILKLTVTFSNGATDKAYKPFTV
jgi:hypothetical protein